jgi:hypothetical protein
LQVETDLSSRDLLMIRKHLFGLAPGKAQEPPWTMRPQAKRTNPTQRPPVARRKDLPMFSRIRDRIKRLEGQIMPQARVFVMFRIEDPDLPPYAEPLAAFKAEKGVGPHNTLVTVTFTFA